MWARLFFSNSLCADLLLAPEEELKETEDRFNRCLLAEAEEEDEEDAEEA